MIAQMIKLERQAVLAAWSEPLPGIAAIALLWSEIELYRQLLMMHAAIILNKQIKLSQRMSSLANRQIGRQQRNARRCHQGELPESLVIQAQATDRVLRQPLLQRRWVSIQRL